MSVQLRCQDLRPGDVLLELSDGAAATRLATDASDGLPDVPVIGAGILSRPDTLIAAQGEGIFAGDLRIRFLRSYWVVFRCLNGEMAARAGASAGRLAGGATGGGVDDLRERILEARNRRYFGSQLVVYVYQFAAAQFATPVPTFFNGGDAKASPSFLAAALGRNPLFQLTGYLLAGQR